MDTPESGLATPSPHTSVLVVDDHRTFTDLVVMALDAEPDLWCVGAAHDAASACAMAARFRPDVVLMDVNLKEEDGLDVAAALLAEQPDLRVIVLTAHADARVMRRAAGVGACALLPKDGSLPELLSSLRSARPGGLVVHPGLLRALITEDRDKPPRSAPRSSLTPREHRVLELLTEGRDVRGIAKELKISVNTCRGYVKTLMSKLDVHSQLEAVVVARAQGLVDDPAGR